MSTDYRIERVTWKRKRRWVVRVYWKTEFKLMDLSVVVEYYLDREGQRVNRPVHFARRALADRALVLAALTGWPAEEESR